MARSDTIDVRPLLAQIEKEKALIEAAKGAPARIRHLNEVIALYGGDNPLDNGHGNARHPGVAPCPMEGCDRVFRGKFNRSNVRNHFIDHHKRVGKRQVEDHLDDIREQMA
jgi:hypothetical protein